MFKTNFAQSIKTTRNVCASVKTVNVKEKKYPSVWYLSQLLKSPAFTKGSLTGLFGKIIYQQTHCITTETKEEGGAAGGKVPCSAQ